MHFFFSGAAKKTPLLLDGLKATPSAAYSTRKLSKSATLALQVRRSTDNAFLDVGFVGNDLDTASLLSFIGSADGWVAKWYDQSGRGKDAEQPTAAKQPRIVAAGVLYTKNTRPMIEWNQASPQTLQHLANTTVPSGFRRNVHAVHWPRTGMGSNGRIVNDARYVQGTPSTWAGSPWTLIQTDGGAQTAFVGSTFPTFDTMHISQFINGGGSSGQVIIGNLDTLEITPRNWYGGLGEIIYFSVDLTSTQLDILNKSAAKYYGVTLA